jgi:hypothetical protein
MRGGLAFFIPILLSGCVEHWLLIRSEPSGADVYLNGEKKGQTPLRTTFDYYGDYEVTLRKSKFETVRKIEPIEAPWWQIFPFDFVTDCLSPFPITDEKELSYTLAPLGEVEPADKVKERGSALKKEMERKLEKEKE